MTNRKRYLLLFLSFLLSLPIMLSLDFQGFQSAFEKTTCLFFSICAIALFALYLQGLLAQMIVTLRLKKMIQLKISDRCAIHVLLMVFLYLYPFLLKLLNIMDFYHGIRLLIIYMAFYPELNHGDTIIFKDDTKLFFFGGKFVFTEISSYLDKGDHIEVYDAGNKMIFYVQKKKHQTGKLRKNEGNS